MRRLTTLFLGIFLSLAVFAGEGTIVGDGPRKINILVYFNYAETDLAGWRTLFTKASEFLYDYTEKEFQLGNVTFAVNQLNQKSRADVIVLGNSTVAHASYPTLDGDRTLGERNKEVSYGQQLRNRAAKPGETSSGPAVMGHELGHYLFGLADEYRGKTKTLVVKPGSRQVERVDEFDFCNQPDHKGIVCVMEDSGGSELCMNLQDARFLHNTGFFNLPLPEPDSDGEVRALWHENDQQLENKNSCWNYLSQLCRGVYNITIPVPTTPPTSSIQGHQALNFTTLGAKNNKELSPGTRLLVAVDTSTTGPRLAEQINTAQLLLERARGAEVALYSTGQGRVFGPVTVTDANLAALKAQVGALQASTGRNLAALVDLMADDANGTSLALMFLGGADGGPSPAAALSRLKAAHVSLFAIGLPGVQAADVNSLTRPTLGAAFLAQADGQIDARFNEAFSEARGLTVLDRRELNLTAGQRQSFTLPVDASDLEFAASWQGGDLDLTVDNLAGTTVRDGNSLVLSADGAPAGSVRVHLENRGAAPLTGTLVISSTSGRIDVDPSVSERTVVYPDLMRISAEVEDEGFDVLDAEATARVVRPDGSVRTVTLYDDGQPSHGDRQAGDGIYSNLFGAYGGNGSHEVTVQVTGANARAVDEEGKDGTQTRPLPPFEREFSYVVTVSGVPGSIPANTLTISPLAPPRDLAFRAAHHDVPALRFRVQTGAGEPVLVTRLPLSLTGSGVRAARLYPDSDRDGEIEPSSEPLAELDLTRGTAFLEPLLLPANTTLDVIVALDFSQSAPSAAAFPFLLLTLGWLAWRRRWLLLLVATLFLAGCADDSGTFPGTGAGNGNTNANVVQVQLTPAAATARGVISEDPVVVGGNPVGGARLEKQ